MADKTLKEVWDESVNFADFQERIKALILTKEWYYYDPDELGEDAFKLLGRDEVDDL